MPLNPCTGWSAKGGVTPLTGAVPRAAPDGSLPGTKVSAGRVANPVRVALPYSRGSGVAAAGAARPLTSAAAPRAISARLMRGTLTRSD